MQSGKLIHKNNHFVDNAGRIVGTVAGAVVNSTSNTVIIIVGDGENIVAGHGDVIPGGACVSNPNSDQKVDLSKFDKFVLEA